MSTNASCVGNTREIELETQNKGLRRVQLALEESLRYVESIVETIREPLIILDADLKIISANRNFYRTFKVTPGETIGSFIYELLLCLIIIFHKVTHSPFRGRDD